MGEKLRLDSEIGVVAVFAILVVAFYRFDKLGGIEETDFLRQFFERIGFENDPFLNALFEQLRIYKLAVLAVAYLVAGVVGLLYVGKA